MDAWQDPLVEGWFMQTLTASAPLRLRSPRCRESS